MTFDETRIVVSQATGEQILKEIEVKIEENLKVTDALEKSWAYVGLLLLEVQQNNYWKAFDNPNTGEPCKTFREYLEYIQRKGPTQLYSYISVVRELGEYVGEEGLVTMGITKAREVAKSVKETGLPPTQDTINQAMQPEITVAQLHRVLFGQHEEEKPKGEWMDVGSFPVSPEEKIIIVETFNEMWAMDPVVSESLPKGIRWKEAVLRLAMEYQGSKK
jgi:hypothetical protein